MAYDPEARIRYVIEQHTKYKTNEELRKQEEFKRKSIESGQVQQKERSWQEHMYVDTDSPGTMDNVVATIWYIIIMLIGAVFNDRLLIWVIATIVWWRHINRKVIRQKEWDKKHNGGNK